MNNYEAMEMLKDNTILFNNGVVSQVMINRPNALNSVNIDIIKGIINIFSQINNSKDVRAVTLWGAGSDAFSAGSEVSKLKNIRGLALTEYVTFGCQAMMSIEKCKVPVIAGVQGYCFGAGLEVALSSDIIVAAKEAKFGFPESELGMIPAFGGVARLLKRVSIGNAKKLLFTADLISAEEALKIGLIDEIAEEGKLTNRVDELAENISKRAPLALQSSKKLINYYNNPESSALLQKEVEKYMRLSQSVDYEEGIDAFLQKRSPKFYGR